LKQTYPLGHDDTSGGAGDVAGAIGAGTADTAETHDGGADRTQTCRNHIANNMPIMTAMNNINIATTTTTNIILCESIYYICKQRIHQKNLKYIFKKANCTPLTMRKSLSAPNLGAVKKNQHRPCLTGYALPPTNANLISDIATFAEMSIVIKTPFHTTIGCLTETSPPPTFEFPHNDLVDSEKDFYHCMITPSEPPETEPSPIICTHERSGARRTSRIRKLVASASQ
jgi:hypothetical protein